MRVAHVIARMNVGGPAHQVAVLARTLPARGVDVGVFVGQVDEDEGDYLALRAPGLDVVPVAGLGRAPRPSDDALALGRLVKALRSWRPDVVHTHTAKAGALGRIAARLARVPVVVHGFHGHLLHGYFSPRVTSAVVRAERGMARLTTRLLAEGDRVRQDLLAAGIGKADQWVTMPPGISLPAGPGRGQARETLGLPTAVPVVTFVGRLTRIKRPDRLADVAIALGARVPDAHLLVVGDGELMSDLRQRLQPLGERALLLGWRSDIDVVYAAADAVVLTSDNEGMPYSLIEAALAERPVVSTAVGSVSEVVVDGRTGFLRPPDAGALATALERLLTDRALARAMGADAARRAARLFSEDRLVDDTVAVYDETLAAKRVPLRA